MQEWIKDTGIRAIRTMAQTAAGIIGSSVLLTDVNWTQVLSATVLAAIMSILMSIDRHAEINKKSE